MKIWKEFYAGYSQDFHEYEIFENGVTCKCEMSTLGMAKTVSEEWASLLNYPEIKIDNEEMNEFVQETLTQNNFKHRFNSFIEKTFAIGNGLLVVNNLDVGRIEIDEFYMWNTIPLEIKNEKMNSILLYGQTFKISDHLFETEFIIYKKFFEGTKYIKCKIKSKKEYIYEDDYLEIIDTNFFEDNSLNINYFHFFKPNITNNFIPNDTIGISIFANAMDILKNIDYEYDSLKNDFEKGKMKLIIHPDAMQKKIRQVNGEDKVIPIANTNNTFFVPSIVTESAELNLDKPQPLINDLIKEINIPIRVSEHIEAIQFQLDLLAQKCGLGTGYFKFNNRNGITKTATEVISQKSELFRNMKKHEFLLKQNLVDLINDIIRIGILNKQILNTKYEITIKFDDSIANDDNTIRDEMRKDVSLGVLSRTYYLMKQYNLTEDEAEKMLKKISEENKIEIMDTERIDNLFQDKVVD